MCGREGGLSRRKGLSEPSSEPPEEDNDPALLAERRRKRLPAPSVQGRGEDCRSGASNPYWLSWWLSWVFCVNGISWEYSLSSGCI